AVARSRIEVGVKRVLWTADNAHVSWTIAAKVVQLIHPLEVPAQGSTRAMNFIGHLAARPLNHSTGFQGALNSIAKLHEGADIILIRHGAGRAALTRAEVCPLAGNGQRAFVNVSLLIGDHSVDWSGKEMGHVDHMRHQVAERAETG